MDAEETTKKLIFWIQQKVLSAGMKGVVTGMSGGIDSAVLSVLCHRAFPDDMMALIMPCYSNGDDEDCARLVAEKFDIETRMVSFDDIYDRLSAILPKFEAEERARHLAGANIKPRLRMIAMYHVANQRGYLVAGSGNLSELTIGYFTKYGDGGADIIPLGNLVKSQVRELARYLGIPQRIIDRPPSAGLWSGQTDEQEMGLTYEELDNYILSGKASAEIKQKIEQMHSYSDHKRLLPSIPDF